MTQPILDGLLGNERGDLDEIVDPADPLFNLTWIPWKVVVDQRTRGLKV